ncbi:MAG: acetate/propionate family kinase [Nitrospirales bacterium]
MRILTINSGSSSLKVKVIDLEEIAGEPGRPVWQVRFDGDVEDLGAHATLRLRTAEGELIRRRRAVPSHAEAVRAFMQALGQAAKQRGEPLQIEAVGHRVVHGGSRFQQAVRINDAVLRAIEDLTELAPLHNPGCLAGIHAAQEVLGRAMPMVAVFDTAFHTTLPAPAATYAIPRDLAAKHEIRRYGFHGIAHASMVAAYAASAKRPLDEVRVITLQLGNGCSATAVDRGRSVDTSMGFTPLEGLVMGTRSGDLDPAILTYLARREGVSVEEVERWLNERSGLLGVSGLSSDMREVLQAAERHSESPAALAVELFCYRARKYIGAYLAALGGAEAVVFGGGIGERAPAIRSRICDGMAWCGLRLDSARNETVTALEPGEAERISADDAPLAAYVAAVDEETEIARETVRVLRGETTR